VAMDHPSKLSRRCETKHRASLPHSDAPKARSGVALVGNPEGVEAVVGSIRRTCDERVRRLHVAKVVWKGRANR